MSLWTLEEKCQVALDLNSLWSSNLAFGTCPELGCSVICGHSFSTSWRDTGRCCYQKEIPVVITNRISPILCIKSWQWIHSAQSVIPRHASKWKKKKKWSISQEIEVSFMFHQESNLTQMLSCLSQMPLCRCLHCQPLMWMKGTRFGPWCSFYLYLSPLGGLACYLSIGNERFCSC